MTVPSRHTYDPSTHLAFDDLALDSPIKPSVMESRLKASKTDPFRKGISIFVGRTNNDLCLIAAMLAYIARRGGDQGPLFRRSDGQPLTQSHFVMALRERLATCGFDQSKYFGHSFRRIGPATTATLQGIPDSTIKVLGR